MPRKLLNTKRRENTEHGYIIPYASKALSKPLIGHGIKSTKDFDTSNPAHHKMLRPSEVKKAENFQLELNNRVVAHAHNFPLQIIFEFGYLGALLFLMALWWLLNSNFTNCDRHVKAATLASVFGLLLFCLFVLAKLDSRKPRFFYIFDEYSVSSPSHDRKLNFRGGLFRYFHFC